MGDEKRREGRRERCDNAENIAVFLCLLSLVSSFSSSRFVLRVPLENGEGAGTVGSALFNALNQHGNIMFSGLAFLLFCSMLIWSYPI